MADKVAGESREGQVSQLATRLTMRQIVATV
jgi:hypothetical protein